MPPVGRPALEPAGAGEEEAQPMAKREGVIYYCLCLHHDFFDADFLQFRTSLRLEDALGI